MRTLLLNTLAAGAALAALIGGSVLVYAVLGAPVL